MKKILFYILAVITVSAGCRKTYVDTIAGQAPDQRLAAALTAYQKKLTGAPYGWIFLESTTGLAFNQGVSQDGPKIVLAYYMQFIDSNNVSMFSDFDTSMATTPKTSGYRVKALTRPALIFDTYNYLHVPCDPDPNISKSPFGTGFGWGTDFEFSFADSTVPTDAGDTIRLTGNLNSATGLLIKATQQQRDAYFGGGLKGQMGGLLNIPEYFKRLSIGGVTYEIRINADRSITFTWATGGGQNSSQTVSFYTTPAGIILTTPVINGSQTITSLDNITWDPIGSILSVSINGQHGSVIGAAAPLNNDVAAPERWWRYASDNRSFWASQAGFHVNGVDDAFGVRKLVDTSGAFYFYAYFPNFFTNPADAFLPIMLKGGGLVANDHFTAVASPPTFTNGRIIFNELGSQGTVPPGGPVDRSNTLLYNPAGYYLVQTGSLSYDMVIASNARSWISWVWPQ